MDAFKFGKQLAKNAAALGREEGRRDKLRRMLMLLAGRGGAGGAAATSIPSAPPSGGSNYSSVGAGAPQVPEF